MGNRLFDPCCFDQILNSQRYFDFLDFLDGVAPHYGVAVQSHLGTIIPNIDGLVEKGILNSHRRCHHMNLFVYGYLKSKVYQNRPQNTEEVKAGIRAEANSIPPEMIRRSVHNFFDRLGSYILANVGHFEHLLNQNIYTVLIKVAKVIPFSSKF